MKIWNHCLLAAGLLIGFISCQQPSHNEHNHEGHTHEGHNHDEHDHGGHAHDENVFNYTRFSNQHEYFIQFPVLVKGEEASFLIHLTQLADYSPAKGDLVVELRQKGKTLERSKASSKDAGIYSASLKAPQAGRHELRFIIGNDSLILRPVHVVANHNAAHQFSPSYTDKEGDINYSKEQAWASNFATTSVQYRKVGQIIPASGEFHAAVRDQSTVVAKRSGVVRFLKPDLCNGMAVKKGEALFTVSGEGIVEDQLEMDFQQAVAAFDESKADFERKEKLIKEAIIGQKDYEAAKSKFQQAEASLKRLQSLFNKGKQRHLATASASGFVMDVLVSDGQYVEAGQTLLQLLQSNHMHLEIEVAPKYASLIPKIQKANFVNPYTQQSVSMAELKGKVLSYDRFPQDDSRYLKVYFELEDHPFLPPGGLVEAYLQTQAEKEVLSIPRTALLEEMGSYLVFVQCGGEQFEKRIVQPGHTDGEFVEITRGLKAGERVVSKGVLRIKQASMQLKEAAHGHQH